MSTEREQGHPHDQAQEPTLDDQVDQLLNDVEALTNDVLAEKKPAADDQDAAAPVDQQPPDDDGLSGDSPLIQDGERTPPEEIVADVDQELDRMEKLVSGIGGGAAAAGTEISASDDRVVPPAVAPSEPEDTVIEAAREHDAAEDIPDLPPTPTADPSEREIELDHDLDALLADHKAPAPAAVERPAPPAPKEVAKPREQAVSEISEDALASVSLWKVIRIRSSLCARKWSALVTSALATAVVVMLERFDAMLGSRVPPMIKELIGFCALGTLAVCLVAILVALL